jgi:protein-tyrosine-phosphatase
LQSFFKVEGIVRFIAMLLALLAFKGAAMPDSVAAELNPRLAAYVARRVDEFDEIPVDRREQLQELAAFVVAQRERNASVRLTFICTHNSRRSHMAQLFAAAAAAHYGIDVESYSGGTEGTAFNPRAIAALGRAGFDIKGDPLGGANPRYLVRFTAEGVPLESFSKAYDEDPNPSRDFCAVLVCSQADEACPMVAGAAKRLAIAYEDPLAADGTPEEATVYDTRCAQIAREMLFAFAEAAER